MVKESNQEYYARRAADEHKAADEASDAKLAELHRELASRYEELAHRARLKLRVTNS